MALVFVMFLPSVAFAVWWNPFSWFENKSTEHKENIEKTQTKEEFNPNDWEYVPDVPDIKEEEKVNEPIIQEKIITKTITIDNPELQKKIDELTSENAFLKKQVSNDSKSLTEISNKYNEVADKYNNMVNALPKFEYALKDMIGTTVGKLVDNLNECRSLLRLSIVSKPYIPYPSFPSYTPISNRISCTATSGLGSTTYINCY